MRILLLGKNGQLGWELVRSLAPLGEVIALDRQGKQGLCGDLMDLDGLVKTVAQVKPNLIVNAAAYTAVDQAESHVDEAYRVNSQAVAVLAQAAKKENSAMIHYSTDYVFSGDKVGAYSEDDETGPLNVYGQSKLAGEVALQQVGVPYLILRTSWVYGVHGNNFLKTMLKLAKTKSTLSVVDDQLGSPMGAALLADLSAHAARQFMQDAKLAGVYHVAPSGQTSWHDYAAFIFEYARQLGVNLALAPDGLKAIPSASYLQPARRPLNSVLNTTRWTKAFRLNLPAWQLGVSHLLEYLCQTTH